MKRPDLVAIGLRAKTARAIAVVLGGSIDSPVHIVALAEAGVDAFTIGSAVFNRNFVAGEMSLRGQLAAILAACR